MFIYLYILLVYIMTLLFCIVPYTLSERTRGYPDDDSEMKIFLDFFSVSGSSGFRTHVLVVKMRTSYRYLLYLDPLNVYRTANCK